jgi:hypothetical protein
MSNQKHEQHKPSGKAAGDAEMAQVVPPSKEAAEEEKKRAELAEKTAPPSGPVPYTGAAPETPAIRKKAAELKKFQAEQQIKEAEEEIKAAEKAEKEQEQKEKSNE